MPEWILYLLDFLPDWDWLHVLLIALIKVVAILIPLVVAVAYLPYAERKIIGYMQLYADPYRTQSGRSQGMAATDSRCTEADSKRNHHSD